VLPGARRRGLVALRACAPGAVLLRDEALLFQRLSGARAVELSAAAAAAVEAAAAAVANVDALLLRAAPFYLEGDALAARAAALAGSWSPPRGGTEREWSSRAMLCEAVLNANSFSVRGGGGAGGAGGASGGTGGGAGGAGAPTCRAFFPRLAFANHDCDPNAEADEEVVEAEAADAAPSRFAYSLMARRAIAEGEEVTISYVPRAWPLARRRGALSSTFDFDCDCARCAREAAEEAAEAAR
jgi:hypothetical protein